MSENKKSSNSSNYHAGCRKKQNKKRQASSPLSDNGEPLFATLDNKSEQKKGQPKKCKQDCGNSEQQRASSFIYDYNHMYQNMSFQQQTPFGMSQPAFVQGSPPAQYNSSAFGQMNSLRI